MRRINETTFALIFMQMREKNGEHAQTSGYMEPKLSTMLKQRHGAVRHITERASKKPVSPMEYNTINLSEPVGTLSVV